MFKSSLTTHHKRGTKPHGKHYKVNRSSHKPQRASKCLTLSTSNQATFTSSSLKSTKIPQRGKKNAHTTPFTHQSRFISLYDIPTPGNSKLHQNFDPNDLGNHLGPPPLTTSTTTQSNNPLSHHDPLQDSLQADVDENVSHGMIDFSTGRVVFDARSSLHNFVRFRVMEHHKTEYTQTEQSQLEMALSSQGLGLQSSNNGKPKAPKSPNRVSDNIYYSFQEVYDDGDEEHEDPFIALKSVIKAGSDNVNTLHLTSTSALIGGLTLASHPPQSVLYIGNWGGVVPQYLSTKIGSDVEILDPDAMSQYMSKTYSPAVFFENYANAGVVTQARPRIGFTKELPEHPFDIIYQHKLGLLQRRKQHKKQSQLSPEIDGADGINFDDVILSPGEIEEILRVDFDVMDGDLLNQTTSPLTQPTLTNTPSHIDIMTKDQGDQEQEELDRAHAQLQLQEAIISFQLARNRGTNKGAITMHPPAVDTHSHLSSLYSQHYLDPTQAIPKAIKHIQHQRHFKHLQTQFEQTQLNIKAMVMEKFDLRPLLLAQPDHPHFEFKRQFDAAAHELTMMELDLAQFRAEVLEAEAEEGTSNNNNNNNTSSTKKKSHPNPQEIITKLQLTIQQKRSALIELANMLNNIEPTQDELQGMSNLIIKWLTRRFNSIQAFNSTYLELDGGEHEEGRLFNSGNERDEDDGFTESLNDIFDSTELPFANEFNRQFTRLMVLGQDEFDNVSPFGNNNNDGEENYLAQLGAVGRSASAMMRKTLKSVRTALNTRASNDNYDDYDYTDGGEDDDIELHSSDTSPTNTRRIYEHVLEDQSMDGIWFQGAIFTLKGYEDAINKHQETSDSLQASIHQLSIPPQTLQILSTIHENILDSIFLPMRGYDAIVHDHNNDPLTPESMRLIKEALIVEGVDDVLRHGIFVKRVGLITDPKHATHSFEGLLNWIPDLNNDVNQIKQAFKHVYWQQTPDHIIFAATDGVIAGDHQSTHPIDTETMVDISVALWQSGAIGLDVVETSDAWHYLHDVDRVDFESMVLQAANQPQEM